MKIRSFILYLIILVCGVINGLKNFSCKEYDDLKLKGGKSIKLKDLPQEFTKKIIGYN